MMAGREVKHYTKQQNNETTEQPGGCSFFGKKKGSESFGSKNKPGNP